MVKNHVDTSSIIQTIYFGIIHYVALLGVWLVHYIAYVPGFIFILYIQEQTHSFASLLWTAPLAAMMSMVTYFSCVYLCKNIFLRQVTPGMYQIKSSFYVRQWVITKLLDMDEVRVLADSLYFPWLVRCLGGKLGKRVEMGETPYLIPDLITLQDEAFTATGVGMAWPNIYQGLLQISPINIGKRAFCGNISIVPPGTELGNESLLGCLTRPPAAQQAIAKRSAWLGSPPMFLPRREEFTEFSENYTTKPKTSLYISRLMLEFLRVILPSTYNLITLISVFGVCQYLLIHTNVQTTLLLLPVLECSVIAVLVLSLIGLKWLVQGRLSPTVKPLWDVFIRKIDLVEYAWTYFICPRLGELLLGTPFFPMLLRCLGVKIGKQVFIESDKFAEFDLISIGDEACINAYAMMDTHLYEDRVFKTSTIEIQAGCNVGIGAVVLYDTVMEKNAQLGSLSLLMKGEHLPANSDWHGLPCQPAFNSEVSESLPNGGE
jgi:non-ribosomal peptide synthetase-like protein